ncbi:MAG TPA: FecR family protein [bacterium]|nr:FecR family protein [bacterium]
MRKKIYAFIILVSVALLPCAALAGPVASVGDVTGTVELRSDEAGQWSRIEKQAEAAEGAAVRTLKDSGAVLRWFSGNTIKISQLTAITISKLLAGGGVEKTSIDIEKGRALVAARKLEGRESVFEIRTPYGTAAVRGTRFVVEVDETESRIIVIDGIVEVITDDLSVTLDAGSMSTVPKDGAPEQPRPVPQEQKEDINKEFDPIVESAAAADDAAQQAEQAVIEDTIQEILEEQQTQQEILDNVSRPEEVYEQW